MGEIDLDKIIDNKLGTFIIRTDNPQNMWTARLKDYINNEEDDDGTALTGTVIGDSNIRVDVADISTSYDNTKIYLSHDETCNIIKNIFEKDMILDTRIKNYIVNKINTYRTLNDESYNKFA